MFVVYVLLLDQKRIYVGMTPRWRIQTRYDEHCDPMCFTTKWTTKYPPTEKLWVSRVFHSKLECCRYEHELTKFIMTVFGLDSTRGGNFVMGKEGGEWWVPKQLSKVPRFTQLWNESSCIRQELLDVISHFRM